MHFGCSPDLLGWVSHPRFNSGHLVCCLVGAGEGGKHGLCLGALPARIAAGAGGPGLRERQCI